MKDCFGIYDSSWLAYRALKFQDNERFYVTREEDKWLLLLGRSV